jgi:hypothetical protein
MSWPRDILESWLLAFSVSIELFQFLYLRTKSKDSHRARRDDLLFEKLASRAPLACYPTTCRSAIEIASYGSDTFESGVESCVANYVQSIRAASRAVRGQYDNHSTVTESPEGCICVVGKALTKRIRRNVFSLDSESTHRWNIVGCSWLDLND